MTDETGEQDATSPGWANPGRPTPPASGPPAWGTDPQAWPPPPPDPAPATPMAPPAGPVTPPSMPAPGPGWSSGWGSGGAGHYGYTDMWSPPADAPRPPNAARRIVAAIAVITLVLASGAVGAIISAAVHGNPKTPAATSPFTGGPNGNGSGVAGDGSGVSSAITSKVNPALVNIYTTIDTGSSRGEAAGTGMVITSSGEVLTNNHVIADATTVHVELVATGSTHTAKVLGYDVKDDIALLQIDGVSNLDTVSFADATKVAIGDAVVAIGNAGGVGGTPAATSGSVTALDQKVTAGDQSTGSSETLTGMIEISAPIKPGDSGGPLVDSDGDVIGMNTAAATNDRFFNQGGSSTAFAIPINRAVKLAHQIEAQEASANVHIGQRGLLGIRVQDIATQLTCDSVPADSGALIASVQSGSPAGSAGLSTCDVIVGIDSKKVATTADLNAAMFPYHPGEKVTVSWVDQSGVTRRADVSLIVGPPV
jgi:S1-C subfamily serine protease